MIRRMEPPPTPLTLAEQIGRQVRAALAEQRKRQEDLAEVLGMTQASVSRRVLGKQAFGGDELIIIARYLGVDPARFLQPLPCARPAESSPARTSASSSAA
jgi:transcriptional regulator with XRE-family HTH domain